MSGSDHGLYVLAAYGVALVLMAVEVWTLVRCGRAQARRSSQEPLDET